MERPADGAARGRRNRVVVLAGGAALDSAAQLRVILVAGAAMFLLGLADDLAKLKPSTKLVAEIASRRCSCSSVTG